jgi:hypothetical protein
VPVTLRFSASKTSRPNSIRVAKGTTETGPCRRISAWMARIKASGTNGLGRIRLAPSWKSSSMSLVSSFASTKMITGLDPPNVVADLFCEESRLGPGKAEDLGQGEVPVGMIEE